MPIEMLIEGFSCKVNCKLFNKCRSLCSLMSYIIGRVEYEPPKESQLTNQNIKEAPWPKINQCTGESILKKYFILRQTPQQIAKDLEISKSYVYRVIKRGRQTIAQNIQKKVES